jgi:hypothetical protein
MHTSNKKRFNALSAKEFDEWCDRWYDWDYDYDCGPNCSWCALSQTAHDTLHKTIAETVADLIIAQQNLNTDVRPIIIDERMQAYERHDKRINSSVREDIAFIWPHIKDTQFGRDLFSQIFGQNDE